MMSKTILDMGRNGPICQERLCYILLDGEEESDSGEYISVVKDFEGYSKASRCAYRMSVHYFIRASVHRYMSANKGTHNMSNPQRSLQTSYNSRQPSNQ